MNCEKCGAFMPEGSSFCTSCGAPAPQPQYAQQPYQGQTQYEQQPYQGQTQYEQQPYQGQTQYEQQPYQAQQQYAQQPYQGQPQYAQQPYAQQPYQGQGYSDEALRSNILKWGILGIVFAWCTGILGIIFSAIGRSKVKSYVANGGVLTGKAKTGSILSLVGLILGIVETVVIIIVLI